MAETSHAPNCKELTRNEFKWLLPSTGHFPGGGRGKVGRQPGASYTYQWHTIPRTPAGFHSAACRQPVSSSTRSGRCHHWSRRRARSHCCTEGKGQRAAALVTRAGATAPIRVSPHTHTPCSFPALKPWENNREGDTDNPLLTFTATKREGGVLLKRNSRLEEIRGKVMWMGKVFSKCPREVSHCQQEQGAFPGKEHGQGKRLLTSAAAAPLFPSDGSRQIAMNRLSLPLLPHTHTPSVLRSSAHTQVCV